MSTPRGIDPRTAVEYRVAAVELQAGDLVNTSPGEDDWQQVLGVYRTTADTSDAQLSQLVDAVGDRYIVVQLTDLAPLDSGVYFADGIAMVDLPEDGEQAVVDAVSPDDGVRTYLYTRFELVTIRQA